MRTTIRSSRFRVLLIAIAAVLAANVVALLAFPDDELTSGLGSAAAEALASAPDPAPADDPVADIEIVVSDPGLPVPEPPPADAYADTPELIHGMLELPNIDVAQPLYEGVTLTAINRGPSHWPGTAMPGQVGNVVVAGHRTTYTRPFWDLDLLQPGDELVFRTLAGTFVYGLTRTEVVGPEGLHIVTQTSDRTATLFACHPKGSARQRIVGHFELVYASPHGNVLDARPA